MEKIDYKNIKKKISYLINSSQKNLITSINKELVIRNWNIGRYIVEFEQKGYKRAEYGKELIKNLSIDLTKNHGKGFTERNLRRYRKFFHEYPIWTTVLSKLNWSSILLIIEIDSKNKRLFYIEESIENNWSFREFERQINSQLYERLILSKDKNKVFEDSKKDTIYDDPSEIIKDPIILDFLNLKEDYSYNEKELESKIINKIQDFMLELGKGFSFIKRQYRITISDVNYYADLVFYNRYLRCFVIIELKNGKLKPADLGQLQFYTRYFDEYEKTYEENKAIGILICEKKDDMIVKISLPENNNRIFALEYKKYLPNEEEIKRKIFNK